MANKRDEFEEIIRENLYREADEIEERVQRSETEELSDGQKDKVWQKLKTRIDIYEKESVYAALSEEDREALELGGKMREINAAGKGCRGRKKWKWLASAAAMFALVCVYGTTSMGTGEKFASAIEQIVGERRILKINSGNENKVLEDEKEERAYQEIRESFGIDAVRLVEKKGMEFERMNLDAELQTVEMLYQYEGENLWYMISAGYYDFSFGIDAEDELIEEEDIKMGNTVANLMVYRRRGSGQIKCTVRFTYQKLQYFLAGNISKEHFKLILKNLYFL